MDEYLIALEKKIEELKEQIKKSKDMDKLALVSECIGIKTAMEIYMELKYGKE